MTPTIDKTWELLNKTIIELKDENILIDNDAYENFKKIFKDLYDEIRKAYMEKKEESLDRHKLASIIIVSILKSGCIKHQNPIDENNEIFFAPYVLATSVGMTFMQRELNKTLKRKKKKMIQKLTFPDAFSCDTSYFDIFCRNLYYANDNKQYGLNPLDIAEKLFLLEYIAVKNEKIDVNILKTKAKTEI